jgi:hypothetical protein
MAAHRVVLLGTGSPQLYYEFELDFGPPPSCSDDEVEEVFSLVVGEHGVSVRDGYDLMEWSRETDNELLLAMPAGPLLVQARASRWIEDPVRIRLYVRPCDEADLHGDGWAYLRLVAHRAR